MVALDIRGQSGVDEPQFNHTYRNLSSEHTYSGYLRMLCGDLGVVAGAWGIPVLLHRCHCWQAVSRARTVTLAVTTAALRVVASRRSGQRFPHKSDGRRW